MDIRYPATFTPQDNGFLVEFVDLEDTFTEGETEDAALLNAEEVLTAMLEWRIGNGKPIPAPTPNLAGARYIAPDVKTQAALLVRRARGERSLAELARVMDASWPAVQRLEDAKHWPSLKQLDKAAAALGKKLVLFLE